MPSERLQKIMAACGIASRRKAEEIIAVGRLDYASEGLLLMTNDGALAQKLMKAGSHAPKTYLVKISGKPDERALARLRAGIAIDSEDVSERGIFSGEDQAGAIGTAGVGCGAGKVSGVDGAGSGEVEESLRVR